MDLDYNLGLVVFAEVFQQLLAPLQLLGCPPQLALLLWNHLEGGLGGEGEREGKVNERERRQTQRNQCKTTFFYDCLDALVKAEAMFSKLFSVSKTECTWTKL